MYSIRFTPRGCHRMCILVGNYESVVDIANLLEDQKRYYKIAGVDCLGVIPSENPAYKYWMTAEQSFNIQYDEDYGN